MNNPRLYSKQNYFQKTDASFVIDNFLCMVHDHSEIKNDAVILDVGCGDGGVLLDVLLPKLRFRQIKEVVAIDVSENMIKYAQEHSKHCQEKIKFLVLDVASVTIPAHLNSMFDHIFSFHCLHWVQNLRQAMNNMYTMLKPGGSMLLMFLVHHPMRDVVQNLAKTKKWGKYMQNVNCFIPILYNLKNAENDLKNLLQDIGFCIQICKIEHRTNNFPNTSILKKFILSVDPFIPNIPESQIDDYIEDYLEFLRNTDTVTTEHYDNNNEEKFHCPYNAFVVVASKRL